MHVCLQGKNAPEHPGGSAAKWREPSIPPLCPGLTGEWLGREEMKQVPGAGALSALHSPSACLRGLLLTFCAVCT